MITVPQIVETVIKSSPILSESVEEGLVNYSSLARKLKPEIEEKLYKEVTLGSIIMALKRLRLEPDKQSGLKTALSRITDLSVRSNLISLTFINSPTLFANQASLLDYASKTPNSFLTISHGIYETTIFISRNLYEKASDVFKTEKIRLKTENLSSVTLILPENAINTPGIHFSVFKKLFSRGINVFETVSSFTELTIFLRSEDTEAAFAVLKKL
jgi:aspartokinase